MEYILSRLDIIGGFGNLGNAMPPWQPLKMVSHRNTESRLGFIPQPNLL
jgi:hypothetical protein